VNEPDQQWSATFERRNSAIHSKQVSRSRRIDMPTMAVTRTFSDACIAYPRTAPGLAPISVWSLASHVCYGGQFASFVVSY
jgi:hypothetical protein